MCEEFHCLPSEALSELEVTPWGMVADIISCRAYARAKNVVDNAQSEQDVPDDPMVDMVFRIQADIVREKKI